MVFCVQVGLDGRVEPPLAVPWPARRDVHQREGDQRDEKQDQYERQQTADKIAKHCISSEPRTENREPEFRLTVLGSWFLVLRDASASRSAHPCTNTRRS